MTCDFKVNTPEQCRKNGKHSCVKCDGTFCNFHLASLDHNPPDLNENGHECSGYAPDGCRSEEYPHTQASDPIHWCGTHKSKWYIMAPSNFKCRLAAGIDR